MTATQELFDCSIDEMTLNARTRGALRKAGVTTLDGLEKALLSGGPPGIGPNAGEDIERAIEVLGIDRERRAAARAIFEERDRLANVLMHTTDLMFSIDAGYTKGKRLNEQTIRKATANLLRDTLHKTVDALCVLVPELRHEQMPRETAEGGGA